MKTFSFVILLLILIYQPLLYAQAPGSHQMRFEVDLLDLLFIQDFKALKASEQPVGTEEIAYSLLGPVSKRTIKRTLEMAKGAFHLRRSASEQVVLTVDFSSMPNGEFIWGNYQLTHVYPLNGTGNLLNSLPIHKQNLFLNIVRKDSTLSNTARQWQIVSDTLPVSRIEGIAALKIPTWFDILTISRRSINQVRKIGKSQVQLLVVKQDYAVIWLSLNCSTAEIMALNCQGKFLQKVAEVWTFDQIYYHLKAGTLHDEAKQELGKLIFTPTGELDTSGDIQGMAVGLKVKGDIEQIVIINPAKSTTEKVFVTAKRTN
jgi:hypothetical protein